MEGGKSDSDIALAIGRICIDNPDAVEDLKSILTKDNCKNGMMKYLEVYRGGLLPSISKTIGDGGQYINHLAYKFSSDAANWVWNKDTVHGKIDELITEYEIIETSNKILTKNATYQETIRAWCSKIDQIRLAYSVIKNELGDAKAFYEMLYNLKKANSLLDSQKKQFLELLKANIENFKQFMVSQSTYFMKACSFYLDELTEDDVKAILDDDKYGFKATFTAEPNVYTDKVQKSVAAYKGSLKHIKLKKHWLELTGTESPLDWSEKYAMPIIIMVPGDEAATARKVFATINTKSTDDNAIDAADEYITKISYLPELNSKSSRDKAFIETFLGEYAVLFEDLEKVKQYLITISNKLSELGISSPTGKEKWSNRTIDTILQNEKYTGEVLLFKTVTGDYPNTKASRLTANMKLCTDHHAPIISKEVFNEAQLRRHKKVLKRINSKRDRSLEQLR